MTTGTGAGPDVVATGAVPADDFAWAQAGSPTPELRRRRRFWLALSAVWLVYLFYPALTAWSELAGARRAVALADLLAFAALYVACLTLAWRPDRSRVLRIGGWAVLAVLAVAAVVLTGASGMTAGVYLVSGAAILFRGRSGLIGSATVLAAAAALMVARPDLRDWGTAFAYVFVFVIMRVVATNIARGRELVSANEEIARLAVSEERLRFSRDLHDILGHSLTAITVKAGLASRLMAVDTDRAAAEIADVERLAREALADVRSTVSGYRGITLVGELARARQTLAAAGIDADLPTAVDAVPGARRELFGWVVREGVTNVVRHSGARRCSVEVGADSVSVADDGSGAAAGPAVAAGSGLAGLRERVLAAGGRLEAGTGPDGGFRLTAQVPPG